MNDIIHNYGTVIAWGALGLFLLILICKNTLFVDQNTVLVLTTFGKFSRLARAGLNFKHPFVETVFDEVSLQNFTSAMKFSAITSDQANVHFEAMLVWSTANDEEETIKQVAFRFFDDDARNVALSKTIEGVIRSLVATKKQAEVLGMRQEITSHVKEHVDATLLSWGLHVIDLQINDITFDQVITESMTRVVASLNSRAAAENEGEALRIRLTKEAEARGAAIIISANAECAAAVQRGKGIALFREEVAKGTVEAANDLKNAGLDSSMINFGMWTDMLRHVAEVGKGNVIFLDGSPDAMHRTIQQSMAVPFLKQQQPSEVNRATPETNPAGF